ncbi:MAG: ATP-binding protein [Candidatus Margulisiibacteriota bacterium]
MLIKRELDLSINHSFFLFGPRGTGKSTLLSGIADPSKMLVLNLLNSDVRLVLEKSPHRLVDMVESAKAVDWVVIDEIQYVPELLNEVHLLMEKYPHLNFALTGSSARKLRRGQANLLAGRAFSFYLHPLTYRELGTQFQLDSVLQYGSLPKVFALESPQFKQRFLKSYTNTYLAEEIQAEGIVRNLRGFTHFLQLAAAENGNCLNFSNMANDTGIDSKTIKSYFGILEDTLIGFILPAYHHSIRKRQKTHPKFYFFDTGVTRALVGTVSNTLVPQSSEYGRLFEQFIVLELLRMNHYFEAGYRFSYLASPSMEIDLVIERPGQETLFVEIKSRSDIQPKHLQSLHGVVSDTHNSAGICICQEPIRRVSNGITICPWQEMEKVVFTRET